MTSSKTDRDMRAWRNTLLLISRTVLTAVMVAGGWPLAQASADSSPAVVPDDAWDAAFSRTDGWTGGDVAGTVDLGDGRTLWLFGDSWIGTVKNGRHAPGSVLVNNTIAVQPTAAHGEGRPPRKEEIRFFRGRTEADGRPAAWLRPDTPGTWYWPSGGGAVVPGPQGQPRLIVFFFHLARQETKGRDSAWDFRQIGNAMGLVDNVRDDPGNWCIRQQALPHSVETLPAGESSSARDINWGVSALINPDEPSNGTARHLYIYGVRDTGTAGKQLFLARVPVADAAFPARWQFYAGKTGWSSQVREAVPVADGVTSELSVETCRQDTHRRWIMVHSEPHLGRRIFVRSAAAPEGPWSKPIPIYTVPGLNRDKHYFTYAAKGHLHLSRENDLLVTYIINADELRHMAEDAAIYRPRFIHVPLSVILPRGTILTP